MATGSTQPFAADANGNTVTLAVSTTSASATLPATPGTSLLLYNTGSGAAFVEIDAPATVPAAGSPGSLPLLPGASLLLDIGRYAGTIAAVTASGTTTLLATRGSGSAR